jgi:hypothetical protein
MRALMNVKLVKAKEEDLVLIHEMQIKAFEELLVKYQDFDTNPGAESIDKIIERFRQNLTTYLLIFFKEQAVGAIRILYWKESMRVRISPMFILPQFQGKKIGQKSIFELENMYSKVKIWELDTIVQESQLCYFYEKLGYKDTGKRDNIKMGMDIVYYRKVKNLDYT